MSTTLLGSVRSMALILRAFLLLILHLPCSLFQLSLPQSTALIAASPPWITTAPPNAQDELHTFPNQHAGLLSPTLHPTSGQEQTLPFPTPPTADALLAPAEGGRNTLGQEENISFGAKVLKWEWHPLLPTVGRAGCWFSRGLCFLMQHVFYKDRLMLHLNHV